MTVSTPPEQAVDGSVLSGALAPAGAMLSVTSIRLPGSIQAIAPGSQPQQVLDPTTGKVTGSLLLRSDGTFTFTPAVGFTGLVPTMYATVTSSDGQAKDVPLTVIVETPVSPRSSPPPPFAPILEPPTPPSPPLSPPPPPPPAAITLEQLAQKFDSSEPVVYNSLKLATEVALPFSADNPDALAMLTELLKSVSGQKFATPSVVS